jgi:hypothetical protein
MNRLKPYNKFIDESVRDLMTPRSLEDVINSIDGMINDGKKLSTTLGFILNQTQGSFMKFWHPKDVLDELISSIDYEISLKTLSELLSNVDKELAFGMETIYIELWNTLSEDIKKESVKTLLSKYEII